MLLDLFEAQALSRHLDLEARRLSLSGEGYYTIGSAGHESNAAVAMALRPTDPALLHYRSGAFYCARAAQVEGPDPVRDVLLGLTASRHEPISGGRHKVFGNAALHVIPQTSTIASHLPRAVGLAFALHRARRLGVETPWPEDAVVGVPARLPRALLACGRRERAADRARERQPLRPRSNPGRQLGNPPGRREHRAGHAGGPGAAADRRVRAASLRAQANDSD